MRLRHLYFISFIEGGVVMVTEIAGARILAPFFGASLYSWIATLTITLFALMTGYYVGGHVTTRRKYSSAATVIWVFFLSGLTVLLMPSLGQLVMQRTLSFSFFAGLMVSELLFLFPPIFLMGMISPMIIFQITKKADQSGRSAGNIYAVSTCGGILFTLVFGFLIIPYYGISFPVRLLGLCVASLGLAFLLKNKLASKKLPVALFLMLFVTAMGFNKGKLPEFPPQLNMRLVEHSEGLLGELKVIDQLKYHPNGGKVYVRKLRTNNIEQNYVFADAPTQSLMSYVNFTKHLIRLLPQKESALLVGLGAGSLYSVLSSQYRNVETVEIDQRMYDIGVKYFGLPAHQNHFITDGRYYLNVTDKKYDLIVLDVIIGESVPGQLITLECFQKCFRMLGENGALIIEHGGLHNLADNSLIPSIIRTLKAAGFQVSLFNPVLSRAQGDVMFMATKSKFDLGDYQITDDVLIKGGPLTDYALPDAMFAAKAARVLTDDLNDVDVLLRAHYFQVRANVRKELAKMKSLRKN